MSGFVWPQADLSFQSEMQGPQPGEAGHYFVCVPGAVLQLFDESGAWRPAQLSEYSACDVQVSYFMGHLGNTPCFAVLVNAKEDQQFANLRMNLGNIQSTLFDLAGRALQLCDWHKQHQFCGQCGAPMQLQGSDRSMRCADCGLNFYPRLSPSIIVLVHREDEVLLARNHLFPEGLFSTLAGFVEPGESIENTVRREVHEEVGVRVGNLSYRGSQPWPFPNSLMLGFHAEYDSGDFVLQEDEIAEARWFHLSELPLIPGKFAISRWLIDEYLSMRGFEVES